MFLVFRHMKSCGASKPASVGRCHRGSYDGSSRICNVSAEHIPDVEHRGSLVGTFLCYAIIGKKSWFGMFQFLMRCSVAHFQGVFPLDHGEEFPPAKVLVDNIPTGAKYLIMGYLGLPY